MTTTLAEIAVALGADVLGDGSIPLLRPAEPQAAGPDDLALALHPRYADALRAGDARAAVLWADADWRALGLDGAVRVPRARLAMAQITRAFDTPPAFTGIHPTAIVDATAHLGEGVSIGPYSIIGPGAQIGAGCWIDSHVSIAGGARIGEGGLIRAGVRIARNVVIGDRIVLQPNAVIGGDGFSFVTAGPSNEERAVAGAGRAPLDPPGDARRHRIQSLGGVMIGDDVEVGANATIDAGTIRPTQVGDGSKIDNLVQVGHNVVLGVDCVLSAQAAVAGSARLGDRVVMGGKSGIRDNVTVGCDVVLAGGAIVLGEVPDGSFVMGYPAQVMPEHRAQAKALRRLPALIRTVAALQKAVSKTGQSD